MDWVAHLAVTGGSHSYCSLKPLWLGIGEVVLLEYQSLSH